eukprot:gnl/TRDRNA2_/TRDRNA2_155957_c1_seq1.p1 gnl/TRDRNA2_/TRDRNA2_155957_c1~~gnl/TRDRNA2_/TRDRNA2_155957_c1_seq1.p1  ORF type:complete len:132 (-),score=19.25 gnl/TRDRNA2_/TRDRNA2_155957_c1_seq1:38-433(-)
MGCQASSQNLRQVQDEPYPGGTRDVSNLEESAVWERKRRSKECSLYTSEFSSNSTTSTTDSESWRPVHSDSSHVSDVSSSKAEEPHAEPELTRVDIEVKPQNDIRNSGDDEHEVIPSHHEAGTKPSRRHSV